MKRIILLATLLSLASLFVKGQSANTVTQATTKYDRKAILTDFLQLTPEQGKVFWPIYERYEAERTDLDARRVKLVTDYLNSYKKLDDATSDRIVRESFSIQKSDMALREKYYKEVKSSLNGVLAGRFYQIEEAIQAAVRNDVYSGLPVMQQQR